MAGSGARGDNNVDTRANRRGVLTLISDDDRAGECLIVDNPAGDGGPPQITRLKDPVEFYSFIAERAKAIATMRS
jgi:hypothetical protein